MRISILFCLSIFYTIAFAQNPIAIDIVCPQNVLKNDNDTIAISVKVTNVSNENYYFAPVNRVCAMSEYNLGYYWKSIVHHNDTLIEPYKYCGFVHFIVKRKRNCIKLKKGESYTMAYKIDKSHLLTMEQKDNPKACKGTYTICLIYHDRDAVNGSNTDLSILSNKIVIEVK